MVVVALKTIELWWWWKRRIQNTIVEEEEGNKNCGEGGGK